MNLKKGVILIVSFLVITIISSLIVRYIGFATQTTPSEVSIDDGIKVIYTAFEDSEDTTDFLRMNDSELEAIENMTLENEYGKILFEEEVNLTEDSAGGIIDLDDNIEVSYNLIEINTTELASLEKPAILYLYDLTFDNPRILRNGEVCPSSICQEIDYSGGVLTFTTTQFSNYSAEEISSSTGEETPVSSTGGRDSGSAASFEVKPKFITATLLQGESESFELKIRNNMDKTISITTELQNLTEMAVLSEESFTLSVGEIKTINLNLFALSETKPQIYFGKLIIKKGQSQQVVNIVAEVKEKKSLFDLQIDIPEDHKKINAGDQIPISIQMKNIGLYGTNVDVALYLSIMDFDKKELIKAAKEIIAIKTELTVTRELKVPSKTPPGKYLIIGKMEYGEEFDEIIIESYDSFDVVERKVPEFISKYYLYVIIIAAAFIIAVIIPHVIKNYYVRKRRLYKKKKPKISK